MVYDAFGQMVAEYSGGVWARDYIYRGGQAVASVQANGDVRYLLTDHEGSTRVLMNEGGGIVARHDYLPFGEELQAGTGLRTTTQGYGGADESRQRYGMMERDASGLDHAWWRKYESESGRWTSPDPYTGSMSVSDPQSFNRYSYVHNDPVNYIDPSGLWAIYSCIQIPGGETGGGVTLCMLLSDTSIWGHRGIIPFGGQPRQGRRRKKYTNAQVKAAVGACADELFDIKLNDFQPSSPGHSGSFTGTDPDKAPEVSEVFIVNEVQSFDSAKLTELNNRFGGTPPPRGKTVGGLTIDFTYNKQPTGYSPYRNFTARDRGKAPSKIPGVSAFTETQIWELGNSLSYITGKTFGAEPEFEPGKVFEQCVKDKLEGRK